MPELPDVEGFRRVLAQHGAGERVEGVRVLDDGVLRDVSAGRLRRALKDRRLGDPGRHGKWLLARTDGPTVLMHFGMTGGLVWSTPEEGRHRHDRVVFQLPDGELRFRDMRKLQGIRLAGTRDEVDAVLADQGPDALGIDRARFVEVLDRRRGLKALLTDQSAIAGLGNLLVDEILWRARVHPGRRASDLSPDERRALHREMARVLRDSVRAGRVPGRPSWLTGSRDREGAPCPRCGTPLSKERVGGRTTVWCPACQPRSQRTEQ